MKVVQIRFPLPESDPEKVPTAPALPYFVPELSLPGHQKRLIRVVVIKW
jgi:hypothetical protein